jgi:hypothetical protein
MELIIVEARVSHAEMSAVALLTGLFNRSLCTAESPAVTLPLFDTFNKVPQHWAFEHPAMFRLESRSTFL